jgi:hypothetical protein
VLVIPLRSTTFGEKPSEQVPAVQGGEHCPKGWLRTSPSGKGPFGTVPFGIVRQRAATSETEQRHFTSEVTERSERK